MCIALGKVAKCIPNEKQLVLRHKLAYKLFERKNVQGAETFQLVGGKNLRTGLSVYRIQFGL